jgi:hypothetical protein
VSHQKKENSWTKIGMSVWDGEGDRLLEVSMTYISLTMVFMVVRCLGGVGGRC